MNKKIKLGLIGGSLIFYYFYIHRNDEADEEKIVYHPEQIIGTTEKFGKCALSVVDQQGKTTNQTIPMCNDGYKMKAEGKDIIKCPGSGSYTLDNIKYNYNCSYTPGQSEFTKAYTTTERNYKYQWAHNLFNY